MLAFRGGQKRRRRKGWRGLALEGATKRLSDAGLSTKRDRQLGRGWWILGG